jgi:predicted lipoprotein with Yx(FWY)xxD motif
MKNTAVRAAAVVAAALFATTATACSNSGSSSHQKEDTGAHVKAAAEDAHATPSASLSPGAKDSAAMIMTSNVKGLGEILVDGQGNTLYMFAKDTTDQSTCTGACAKQWPPAIVTATPKVATATGSPSPSVSVTATGSTPSASVSASPTSTGGMLRADLLGTTKRSDGTLQATYNKHPLYYFLEDTKAGQTNGQGLNAFGAKWYVLDPMGNSITKKAPGGSASPTGSSSSSGGIQY